MLDSLYIHVPFCSEKCDYCAFYSLATRNSELQRAYLNRLLEELREKQPTIGTLRSIFIGGGTPSVLDMPVLETLFDQLHEMFAFADDCEVTMECNPSSLTAEKLELVTAGGVNRISLGTQSFSETSRQAIGRKGEVRYAHQALTLVKEYGVPNLNCDLIYALPDQTLDQWTSDLRQLADYAPTHVSAYSLMLEEGTPLTKRAPKCVDDEEYLKMWDAADDILGHAGLSRYEISNFSRPGGRCRHNWEIWHGHPFAAAGPAAHSFDGTVRYANVESLKGWLNGAPPEEDVLTPEDRAVEILIIGLRACDGWQLDEYRNITGYDCLSLRGEVIETLVTEELLTLCDGHLKPTKRGLLLHNYLGEKLL